MNGHSSMESSSAVGKKTKKKGYESILRKASSSEGQRKGMKGSRRGQKSGGSKKHD
jgi:hypothetical protein